MKARLLLNLGLVIFILINSLNLKAQIIGGKAFLKGNLVELGIELNGGFEGATASPPIGYHFSGRGGFGQCAIVADPLSSGWTNYIGDYCMAGTPENGWGILIGNTTGGIQKSNNATGVSDLNTGSTLTYYQIGTTKYVKWSGSTMVGITNIKVTITYELGLNNLFYKNSIQIKNNTATTIPNLYYFRNIDPDNNEASPGGSFTTNNLVEHQFGIPSGNSLSVVSASQAAVAGIPKTYMAFVASGPNFKVTYGGFSNRNGFDIWNEITPHVGTVGVPHTDDEAISLAYKIINLLPGETRSFDFLTVFDSASVCSALSSLVYLSKDGSSSISSGEASYTDTIYTCGVNPTVQILGSNATDFTWNWSPSTFLSSSTSTSAVVSATAPIVYTITGVPTSTCGTTKIFKLMVIPTSSASPITASTSSTLICSGSAATLTATGGLTYTWTPSSLTGSSISVSPLATTVYTVMSLDINHCSSINYITQNVVSCTGIANYNLNNSFKIYPNPTHDLITIEFSENFKGSNLSIYNVLGELVYTEKSSDSMIQLNLTELKNGVYFLEAANQENNIIRTKFIKN